MIRKSELTMALLAAFLAPMLWGTMVLVMMYSHTPDGRFPMTFDTLPIVEITVLSLFMGTILAIAIDALIRHTVHRRWPLVYEVVAGATPEAGSTQEDSHTALSEWDKKAYAEVEKYQARDDVRREFIANLSHELRTPTFNIQGYIETLMDGVKSSSTRKEYLKKANRNVDRMIRLIQDMEVLTHLESHKLELDVQTYSMASQIDDVTEQFVDRLAANDIQLIRDYNPKDRWHVKGDRERIDQVVVNLLSNAIKYSKPEGGFVRIQLKHVDGMVHFALEDNGIGIDQQNVTRIFERFYRVDKSRNRSKKVGGTGLGLAIAKHIIEAHGQYIKVQSSLHLGSTFSFSLPAGD